MTIELSDDGGGTALSPPLPALVMLALLAVAAQSRAWWGTVAVISVLLLSGAFAFAGSQQPLWGLLGAGVGGVMILAIAILGSLGSVTCAVVAAANLPARLRRH